MSETIGERREPIGLPKVCLYILLSNLKKVECKTNLIAMINSSNVNVVFLEIDYHLLVILVRTNEEDTLVNKEMTSREMRSPFSLTFLSLSSWIK